jgi:hypothetical protein
MTRTMWLTAFWVGVIVGLTASADAPKVPGVVIDHSPAASGVYIGSPSIAVLPDGAYVATHDLFGPKTKEHVSATTRVFRSGDRGKTWEHLTDIEGAFWSTVFVHRGELYLLGTNRHHGNVVIRRSRDGGRSWTEPRDGSTGLLRVGEFHCAPVPVVVHGGRVWRGMEDAGGGTQWGVRYRAMVMSAAEGADLLRAESWVFSNIVGRDPAWLGGTFNAWLEGNVVMTPEGRVVDVLRVDAKRPGEVAAVVKISEDGKVATFDPKDGFVDFAGGAKKFTIRFDPVSKKYWALSNVIAPGDEGKPAAGTRNTLALVASDDLRRWEVRCVILHHPDRAKHGFQYVDWQFDGEDLIAACRTAYDDGEGGAHSAHDANYLTFHRVSGFRMLKERAK